MPSGRSAQAGYEAIIINNNPETVSTDYTTSDKLYFEPLTVEDVMNVITLEKPKGIVVSLGGQTAINLAEPLARTGCADHRYGCRGDTRMPKTGVVSRRSWRSWEYPQPEAEAVTDIEAGVRAAERIGYPVLVRPSYVLGGRAMQIVSNEERLRHYLQTAVEVNEDSPVLVDRYIMGRELEVDAICDGKDVFIPGIMEHVEKTGIHSGDSISVYPTFSVSQKAKDKIIDYTVRLGLPDRYRRSVQYPVYPRRGRGRICDRGQSPLVAHRAVPFESDGCPDGRHRHAGHPGPFARGSRALPKYMAGSVTAGSSRRRPSRSPRSGAWSPTSRPR